MNSKKLKAKTNLGNRLTRQERFLLDLFGSTSKSTTAKSSSRKSIPILETSTQTVSTTSSRSNNYSEDKKSSSNPSTTSRSSSSSTTKIISLFDIPASKTSWLTVTPTTSRSPSPQLTQAPTWKLIPLDLSPIKYTRPPAYRLHKWDRRVRRNLSPRYQEEKENYKPTVKLNSKERRKERRRLLFNKV